jgi:hypothetical protein
MLLTTAVIVALMMLLWTQRSSAEPVFPPNLGEKDVDRLRRNLEKVLSLSEEEILRLIPDRSGIYFVGCPNCDGGAQEGQINWTIENPDKVFCKHCNLQYPNDKFPDTEILEVENPVGGKHQYPYWADETGYKHFFQAKGWYLARKYFSDAAQDLAELYFATKDISFAERSALILNRFAEVYPGYCVHHDLPFREKIIFPGSQGFPYPVSDFRAAKWDWWAYMDIPTDLIYAYDLIRDSGALTDKMVDRIENDFFHASVAFIRGFPPALSNMDPTLLRGMIPAGRILNEPDYVHDAVDRIGQLVEGKFFVDGTWREGAVSYHNQTIGGLSHLIEILDGYSDPEGYVHPGDGERFENLDLQSRFPILEKARRIPELLRYPNGRVVPVHDTWAREQRAAPDVTGSMFLPGMGHARLGRGEGPNQTQLYLHFSGGYGHQHADLLGITLYSHENERLCDIGYTHTRYRCWTLSTLAHNTVTVNGEDQEFGSERNPSDGNLLMYLPGNDVFQAIEASGDRAYPDITSTYRRLILQIGISPEQTYYVDLFRVVGGHRHEYTIVGDANHDGTLDTSLDETPYGETLLPPGVTATLPTGESVKGHAEGHNLGYAFIREVRQATITEPWSATFNSQGEPSGSVRIHSLTNTDGTLFSAVAPSIRRADEDDTKLDGITMPVLIHRREGEDLRSLFASILEPTQSNSVIDQAERLALSTGTDQDIALKITTGSITDYVLSSTDVDTVHEVEGITFQGRLGFIRERDGEIEHMFLVGGTQLKKGNLTLGGKGTHRARVTRTLRKAAGDDIDGLVVDQEMPTGVDLVGLTAIVTDGDGFTYGHQIKGLKHETGETYIELDDDPGYEITSAGGKLLFFPGRSWKGDAQVEIPTLTKLNINTDSANSPQTGSWVKLVNETPFTPRDTSEGVVFQDKLWLSNGYYHAGILTRDLWSSPDGINWSLVSDKTPYDGYCEMVTFKDRIWAIKNSIWSSADGKEWKQELEETPFGGRGYGELIVHNDKLWQLGSGNDVWSSEDGIQWSQVTDNTPYGDRSATGVASFNGRLWVIGGRLVQKNDPPEKGYPDYTTLNDVWSSEDGTNWTQVTEHAPWPPRMWSISEVYDNKLWVIGGFSNVNHENLGDVWYTEDGVTWQEFKSDPSFSARHEPTCYVFQNSLWVVAGNSWPVLNDVWKLTLPAVP